MIAAGQSEPAPAQDRRVVVSSR